MSGPVGSIPSLTRSGRPSFSFASRAPSGRTSTAFRVSSAIPMRASLEAATEERRAGEPVAPRPLDRPRDADPPADRERRFRQAREELERRLVERQPVEDARDAERLAELARARAECARRLQPAPLAHRLEPRCWLERPHERRLGAPFLG